MKDNSLFLLCLHMVLKADFYLFLDAIISSRNVLGCSDAQSRIQLLLFCIDRLFDSRAIKGIEHVFRLLFDTRACVKFAISKALLLTKLSWWALRSYRLDRRHRFVSSYRVTIKVVIKLLDFSWRITLLPEWNFPFEMSHFTLNLSFDSSIFFSLLVSLILMKI